MSNKCGHNTYDRAWEMFPPSDEEANRYKLYFCVDCGHWFSLDSDIEKEPEARTVSINDPLPWEDNKPSLSTVCMLLERIAVALEKPER